MLGTVYVQTGARVRERVSVSQLKARLSSYMEKVKGGATLIVVDRGEPVAEITPLNREEAVAARMQDLIRSGLVRSAEGKLRPDFFRRAPDQRIPRARCSTRS